MDASSLRHKKQYIDKTIERLYGIISGIIIDDDLTDSEIEHVFSWIETHKDLSSVEPFMSLYGLLARCLEDGVIDASERDEVLEWCSLFINGDPFPSGVTNAIRRLHGVLSGIKIDKVINDDEILGLQDWLYNFERYRDTVFPFNELFPILYRILEDGKIDTDEREELSAFCNNFTERVVVDPLLHDEVYVESWMTTQSPIFEPILAFCDNVHKIHFNNSTFCFTGPARSGKRSVLHGLVKKCGGIPKEKVVLDLDYLVIGAQSSPYWVYSTYGRKIEGVLANNRKGLSSTIIIHEDAFVRQVEAFVDQFMG